MNKSIYFSDDDREFLSRAERLALMYDRPLSYIIIDALRKYLPHAERAEERGEEPPRYMMTRGG
jgi:hypothetical protein